jgi:hypothetical protein
MGLRFVGDFARCLGLVAEPSAPYINRAGGLALRQKLSPTRVESLFGPCDLALVESRMCSTADQGLV